MDNLRIGFDAKRAFANSTGLGNYSRLVVDVLSDEYPDNSYVLYAPKTDSPQRVERLLSRGCVSAESPSGIFGRFFPSLWRSGSGLTSQLVSGRIDIFHGLSNELPLGIDRSGVRSVVTIHDLIFRRFPGNYKPMDRAIYDKKFKSASLRADRIIAVSECTKRDIMEFYGVDSGKIDVVYQGCSSLFSGKVTAEDIRSVRKKHGLDKPYIVSVGTIEPRKNQELVVKALRGLPDDVHLVLVGRGRIGYLESLGALSRSCGVGDRVRFCIDVADGDLPALYAGALMSAYTSRYEGFGIPIVESLSVGTPVIAATGSCLEEAGGPGAVYVNPDSVDEFVDKARELINSASLRGRMAAEGGEYIKRFGRREMAVGLMEVYGRCCG